MNKLAYEEWKEKYCSKISQDQLDNLKKIHAIEDLQSLIENSNLEAYEFYKTSMKIAREIMKQDSECLRNLSKHNDDSIKNFDS
jgi:hypothetical protein